MLIDLMIKSIKRDGVFAVHPLHLDSCTFSDERIESPFTAVALQKEIKNSANDKCLAILNQLSEWSE